MERRNFLKGAGIVFLASSFSPNLFAKMDMSEIDFREVKPSDATLFQNGDSKEFCIVCGMSLIKFYKTSHASDYEADNKDETHQYCSIHCMFEEAMSEKIPLKNPKVVDVKTLKFINSKDAFYVYDSSKPATMATTSSYAFGDEKDAIKFKDEFGGEILKFDEISKKVEASLADDIALIDKRQKMAALKGEKIYKASCADIKERFSTSGRAKAYLIKHKPCGDLNPKELSQVAHYLKRRD
ncbi:nitrous oxide reductase accessory protein NosL [Campylobacter ureolyticus]|uniref:nitrous oxide reductase accessory protein NosL n=1 Tax=Campylobacter ureolyticus TaxID=827 RepID=UPI00290E918F|nr:nitrous oxide reductase accessory protein NosL [Campylobacter ureolyticus]MDU5326018.1 nitrous oxide reductase accessory protein NosL [Campylobacter ureolyticus]